MNIADHIFFRETSGRQLRRAITTQEKSFAYHTLAYKNLPLSRHNFRAFQKILFVAYSSSEVRS